MWFGKVFLLYCVFVVDHDFNLDLKSIQFMEYTTLLDKIVRALFFIAYNGLNQKTCTVH